jgi:hypothetical protein
MNQLSEDTAGFEGDGDLAGGIVMVVDRTLSTVT